jgi:L-seryl-tRNA(Ser) seleniumtransferase
VKALLQSIPKMDKLLESERIQELISNYGKSIVKKFLGIELSNIREKILNAKITSKDFENNIFNTIVNGVVRDIEDYFSPKLKKIINATGIIQHTNMGRSPISEEILENVKEVSCNYSNLEFNINTGKRGIRYANIVDYLKDLTGAEDAMVVNNNAAAVLLSLSALAKGKEVIISRGELIEIGGSFRIPEVMEQSGAVLREVGATNKTHLKDYVNVINENSALILKAHTSNYRIVGFTDSVEIEQLVEIGKEYALPVMFDLGSGSFIDLSKWGLPDEPTVIEVVKKGVDIVTFSGDKLLGGPQAGIIVGKKKYIDKLKTHPLNRALRIGKFTLSALEPVLKLYFNEKIALQKILNLKLITATTKELRKKADIIADAIKENSNIAFEILEDSSYVGGGAFPMNKIPTVVLTITHKHFSIDKLYNKLKEFTPPIIGRIKNERYILDMRTIFDNQTDIIIKALNSLKDD